MNKNQKKILNIFNEIKHLVKKKFENKIIKKLSIFVLIFIPLLLFDQLTKLFIFNGDKTGNVSSILSNWTIIGFRSQFHTSTTFLDFIGASLPYWSSLLIDYLLIIIFSIILIFSKDKFFTISIIVMLVGIWGNTLDASIYKGVRNVFFIPWFDRGTFNFADIIIVIGAILTAISLVLQLFSKEKNIKNDNKK